MSDLFLSGNQYTSLDTMQIAHHSTSVTVIQLPFIIRPPKILSSVKELEDSMAAALAHVMVASRVNSKRLARCFPASHGLGGIFAGQE